MLHAPERPQSYTEPVDLIAAGSVEALPPNPQYEDAVRKLGTYSTGHVVLDPEGFAVWHLSQVRFVRVPPERRPAPMTYTTIVPEYYTRGSWGS